ncbi:MAG TPA: sugar ABC transporter permease [Clostridiales bacterium]|nr:carbohydrate ABC transporter permease [Clostridia bacterium]HCS74246.1 sugar ABC transporter permease [Clostridiales bacterium]
MDKQFIEGQKTYKKYKIGDSFIELLLIIGTLITLYPFIYIISMSISEPNAVLAQEVWLLPKGFSLGSYNMVFENKEIWTTYGNTIWYTVVGTIINVVFTLMGAYALSRKEFFARSSIMVYITITMFFSGGLIPTFLLVNNLGLYNSRWAMILPGAINTWNLIVARTYFQSSIPDSLPESAKLDGSTDIGIFLKIVLPLSTPIIAVLIVFYAVGHWNAWFNASLYLGDSSLHPLQLFLHKILLMNSPDLLEGMEDAFERVAYAIQLKYASIVVAALPIICIYPFVQKYFVTGVMLGAIKE